MLLSWFLIFSETTALAHQLLNHRHFAWLRESPSGYIFIPDVEFLVQYLKIRVQSKACLFFAPNKSALRGFFRGLSVEYLISKAWHGYSLKNHGKEGNFPSLKKQPCHALYGHALYGHVLYGHVLYGLGSPCHPFAQVLLHAAFPTKTNLPTFAQKFVRLWQSLIFRDTGSTAL